MSNLQIITLLSDFGLFDPYVAEMKAVILSICPNARVVDISHDIRKFDVRMGAFILAQAAPYFPKGTVHVAVVDPGVGTKRRAVIIKTEHSLYVGPDNGLLVLSAQREGISHVYEITNPKYMLREVSRTFHGRDVFCSVAAHLANGISPSELGPKVNDLVTKSYARPYIEKAKIRGGVLHVDGFGNILTNISLQDLVAIGVKEGNGLLLRLKGRDLALRLCLAYGEAPQGSPLVIVGSTGFLEVSVNQGNASKFLGAELGDEVIIGASQSPS